MASHNNVHWTSLHSQSLHHMPSQITCNSQWHTWSQRSNVNTCETLALTFFAKFLMLAVATFYIRILMICTSHLYCMLILYLLVTPINFLLLLTLAVKRRRRVTAIVWRFLSVHPSIKLSVCLSVRPFGKGRLRESTHPRFTSIKEEWSR